MDVSRVRWILIVALAGLLLAGCAYRRHMGRGDELMVQGNYEAALAEYKLALEAKPESTDAPLKIADAQAKLLSKRTAATEEALQRQDYAQAVELSGDLFRTLSRVPETMALLQRVWDVARVVADGRVQAGDFAGGLAMFGHMHQHMPPQQPLIAQRMQQIQVLWAQTLDQAGPQAAKAGQAALALLLAAKAYQLQPSPARQAARDKLRASLTKALTYRVQPQKGARPHRGFGPVIAQLNLAGAGLIELAPTQGAMQAIHAKLTVAMEGPRFDRQRSTEQRQGRYQSGTRQVANPSYASRQSNVQRYERAVLGRQEEVDRQQRYVEQYTADVAREGPSPNTSTGAEQNLYNAQNRLESARRGLTDDRRQLQRAQEELRSTPATREEPVWAEHRYSVDKHTLVGLLHVRASVTHTDGRPVHVVEEGLRTSDADISHAAQGPLKLAADPLSLPSDKEVTGRLYTMAAERATRAVLASFGQYRSGLLAAADAAPDPPRRSDALVRFVLTSPGNVPPERAQALAAASGIPDAAQVLAAP